MEQEQLTKEQILKEVKNLLKNYENKRDELRFERNQISFSIKNCQKLEYSFETTALRLKNEMNDKQIWLVDDIIGDLNNIIEDLEKLK